VIKLLVLCAALALAGCGSIANVYTYEGTGFFYTHTVKPLTVDMRNTRSEGLKRGSGDIKNIEVYYVRVEWNNNSIGDIAKEHGIGTILFADVERLSVLGIWRQHIVHIYGIKEEPLAECSP
jgi:hypothetical protein